MLPIRLALINIADTVASRFGVRVLPAAHLAEMCRDYDLLCDERNAAVEREADLRVQLASEVTA